MDKISFAYLGGAALLVMLLLPDSLFRVPEPAISISEARNVPEATDSARAFITASADLSHGYLLRGAENNVTMRLKLLAPKRETNTRPPLDVVVVLDRSGSMSGEDRIGFARKGLLEAARMLGPNDRFGIVTFASDVSVVRGLSRMEDADLGSIVAKIEAGGGTFLSGGIERAAAMLEGSDRARQILLISDGHANEGVVGEELGRLAEEYGRRGIMITALGVGADYDAQTFIRLADGSGGGYAYVTRGDRIPAAVEGELMRGSGRILEKLAVTVLTADGVTVVASPKHTIRPFSSGAEVIIPTLMAGEERTIFVDLNIAEDAKGIAHVRIDYEHAGKAEELELDLAARMTTDPKIVSASANTTILADRGALGADLRWAGTADHVARGQYDLAARELRKEAQRLEAENRNWKSASVASKIGELMSAVGRLERREFFGGSAMSEATMGQNQAALSAGVY